MLIAFVTLLAGQLISWSISAVFVKYSDSKAKAVQCNSESYQLKSQISLSNMHSCCKRLPAKVLICLMASYCLMRQNKRSSQSNVLHFCFSRYTAYYNKEEKTDAVGMLLLHYTPNDQTLRKFFSFVFSENNELCWSEVEEKCQDLGKAKQPCISWWQQEKQV